MGRRIVAHLRSESGPTLTRLALDFARHGGGDALWLAYVPDGLRGWFGRFADSCDPSQGPGSPFRVARLFDSPSAEEIAFLATGMRGAVAFGPADAMADGARSPGTAAVADDLARGRLHVTTVVLDVHHLPLFARRLRAGADPAARPPRAAATDARRGEAALQPVGRLLRTLARVNCHVLVATPPGAPTASAAGRGRADGATAALDALDAAADLSLVVGPDRPPRDQEGRFSLRVAKSRLAHLAPTTQAAWLGWEDLLAPLCPRGSWAERLARACPRIDRPGGGILAEGRARWADATQEAFARRAGARGWAVAPAAPDQDRGEHWDVRIARGAEAYRVDVKALGKVRRSDRAAQDDWHWVELRGIVDDDWLLGGQADLIAFRTGASFLLVRRADLLAHVCHHVDPEEVTRDPRRAAYRVYHRTDAGGRGGPRPTGPDRGVLTLIPMGRLRLLRWDEWADDAPDVAASPDACPGGSQRSVAGSSLAGRLEQALPDPRVLLNRG